MSEKQPRVPLVLARLDARRASWLALAAIAAQWVTIAIALRATLRTHHPARLSYVAVEILWGALTLPSLVSAIVGRRGRALDAGRDLLFAVAAWSLVGIALAWPIAIALPALAMATVLIVDERWAGWVARVRLGEVAGWRVEPTPPESEESPPPLWSGPAIASERLIHDLPAMGDAPYRAAVSSVPVASLDGDAPDRAVARRRTLAILAAVIAAVLATYFQLGLRGRPPRAVVARLGSEQIARYPVVPTPGVALWRSREGEVVGLDERSGEILEGSALFRRAAPLLPPVRLASFARGVLVCNADAKILGIDLPSTALDPASEAPLVGGGKLRFWIECGSSLERATIDLASGTLDSLESL